MSSASNMSNSVASASPTLVHYNQEFVSHLHGSHQANLMDIAQNARNFVGLQSQEAEHGIQDLNREGGTGWATPMQENRRPQQQSWIHYQLGPPTLSPIQAPPVRGFPENDELDPKGQKRPWSDIVKSEDKDRKKMKTSFLSVDSKELENEYRKIMSNPGGFPQMGGEMLGYLLSSSDPNKVLSKDLQQKMNKIDGELAMTEQTIINLKAKCHELSKVKMLSEKDDSLEAVVEVSESRPQTVARLIYSQNKLKAQQSHGSLSSLGTVTSLPLYNQPSDTLVYRDNKKKFQTFKKLLVAHIAKRQQAEKIRIRYLSERYTQLYNQWVKKINKRENSSCRKEKDAKYREFFEKIFPDLKKQKEDKDKLQRFSVPGNRPAGYARSDAGIEEIVNELHEQEVKEKRMLSLSVTPPMMLDSRQRSLRIIDETRLIRSFDFRQKLWTTAESEIFAEKYQQFPKKFGVISSFLENKTVEDCVLFYYLTKKAANYKVMARRYQAMKRRDKKFRAAQNVQNSDNKSAENSAGSESSANVGPGFSYLSTILLPTSSFASSLVSNAASTSSAYLSSVPVSSNPSAVERPKSVESKKEVETASAAVKSDGLPDAACDEAAEAKKTPSSDAVEEAGARGSPSVDVPSSDCKEGSPEVEQSVQEDAPPIRITENSTEHKAPNDADERDSSEEPPCSEPAPVPEEPTTEVPTTPPASDKKDGSLYAFPVMRVEDISDKEDSDSVATLSADEGPALPSEENKDAIQTKRPKLLIDGHKDAMEKKKYSDDLVLNWETKSSQHALRLTPAEENTQFYAIPNSEREQRSFPSSEIQDRRLDTAYHEGTDTDLMISLVRKNRSPARIKDLIHAAIEKNLQNSSLRAEGDVNGCTSPLGSWPSRVETPINRMPSPQVHSSHQLQHHLYYHKNHNHPPGDFPVPRHAPLPSPANNNELSQQHISMKIMSSERPNSYSPSCFQSPMLNLHDAAPPPAHSHHHQQIKNAPYDKPSSRGPPTHYLESNNRLYELAAVAAERGRLDEKEKRAHKENASRELPYSANVPMLRLPCDAMLLHKGLNLKGASGALHQVGPSATGIHMGSGRGSITKGTSGRSEALQQQGSERHLQQDWPAAVRTSGYSSSGLPGHPSAMDYPSPAQVLRGDFLTAHQMGQSHFSQQNQPYHLQLQYYQGLARLGEKKHRQSPASHEIQLHNKNHSNQEPAKKKPRAMPENVTKNVYQDQAEYSSSHKKTVSYPDDAPKHVPVEPRTHSRNPQLANYYYPLEGQHYASEGHRPKSTQQQINANVDKSQDQQKLGKKDFQPPNQMTAANLIEAIIYLQINRNETDENSLKLPGSSLPNSGLLPHLATPRDDGIPPDRVSRLQLNPQHVAPPSKVYEKSHKFGHGPPQIGDYSLRGASDSRIMPERMAPAKDDDAAAHANKHVKENNPSKKFAPYDHLNQPQYPRHDPHALNPRPTSGGKKFITASDRIEAIIAQDIGNQEDMPTHNEDVQSAIKEYMRISDNRPTKFDALDPSLLSRFPYATVRPYDFDKSYLPFYAPGIIGGLVHPMRMPAGQHLPEDKSTTSQRILSPKVWQHGVPQLKPERNAADSWSPQKHASYVEAKQASLHSAPKEPRSESDRMPAKHSPSHQFHHPPKLTSSDLRNSAPDTPTERPGANSSERASCKDNNCSDDYGSSTAPSLNGPPASSHVNWKAKMLRQHKEQKIAENSLGQYHLPSENISQTGSKGPKDDGAERLDGGRTSDRSAREENKSEAAQEHKDVALRSSSSSSVTPPASGRPSPLAKPLAPHENSADTRNDSCNRPVTSNYWSPRSSTEKCSSNSSDGLRIDLPAEEDDEKNAGDKQ